MLWLARPTGPGGPPRRPRREFRGVRPACPLQMSAGTVQLHARRSGPGDRCSVPLHLSRLLGPAKPQLVLKHCGAVRGSNPLAPLVERRERETTPGTDAGGERRGCCRPLAGWLVPASPPFALAPGRVRFWRRLCPSLPPVDRRYRAPGRRLTSDMRDGVRPSGETVRSPVVLSTTPEAATRPGRRRARRTRGSVARRRPTPRDVARWLRLRVARLPHGLHCRCPRLAEQGRRRSTPWRFARRQPSRCSTALLRQSGLPQDAPHRTGCDVWFGLPATVTRPGFVGCRYWRWLPRWATWRQPSRSSTSMSSRNFTWRDAIRRVRVGDLG
jgi:hypothetical protein